jgi:hypothetical protein
VAVAEFDIVGIEAGSTLLIIEAPSLVEAAPALFRQRELFEPIDSDDSAFGVMEQTLHAAIEGRSDSDLFDHPLLSTFRRFDRLLASGFSSIELTKREGRCGRFASRRPGVYFRRHHHLATRSGGNDETNVPMRNGHHHVIAFSSASDDGARERARKHRCRARGGGAERRRSTQADCGDRTASQRAPAAAA